MEPAYRLYRVCSPGNLCNYRADARPIRSVPSIWCKSIDEEAEENRSISFFFLFFLNRSPINSQCRRMSKVFARNLITRRGKERNARLIALKLTARSRAAWLAFVKVQRERERMKKAIVNVRRFNGQLRHGCYLRGVCERFAKKSRLF